MKSFLFYKLVVSLSSDEFKAFEHYLKGVENARPQCYLLYLEFKKAYELAKYDWNRTDLSKERVAQTLLGDNKPNNIRSLSKISTELVIYLKQYFAYLKFKQKENDFLLEYYLERNIDTEFKKIYSDTETQIEAQKGINNLFDNIELTEILLNYEINQSIKKSTVDLNKHFKIFDDFVLAKKLQIYCLMLNRYLITKSSIDLQIEQEMDSTLLTFEQEEPKNLLLSLYTNCILMLKGNTCQYEILKQKILENSDKLLEGDKKILLTSLLNFCNKTNSPKDGNINYYRNEYFQNYYYMYQNQLFSTGSYTPVMHIKNICSMATAGMFNLSPEEIKNLIEDSKEKVVPQFQNSTYHFNKAVWEFYQNNFKKAIKELGGNIDKSNTKNTNEPIDEKKKKEQYANPFFYFDSKSILLRCYYEVEAEDDFDKLVASFREALRRDKFLSEVNKKEYQNFIKAIVKLQGIRNKKGTYRYDAQKDLDKLQQFMDATPMKAKGWFKPKMNAL